MGLEKPKQVALNDKSMMDNLCDILKVLFTIFMVPFTIFMLLLFVWILALVYNVETHIARLDIRFESASFTSLNGTIGPILNAKSNINFIVANPSNEHNISCNTINATLFYRGDAIAITRLPPFLQLNRSETKLPVQFHLVDQFVDYNIVVDYAHRSIEFGLGLSVEISRGVDDNNFIDKMCGRILGDGTHYNTLEFSCRSLRFVFKPDNATLGYGSCLPQLSRHSLL